MEETLILTPSALFQFLSQVDELKDKEIQVEDNGQSIDIRIGDNSYSLQPETQLAEVDSELVDVIDEINFEGYQEVSSDQDNEVVEGGLIKELIKTLAIGGLVRLTKNAIANS